MGILTLGFSLASGTVAPSAANAAGECAGITNPNKRMLCIEKKADALATRLGVLESKPVALPKNVKICMPTRPGECLAYVGDGAAPRTVGGEQPDSRWDLQ